MRTRTLGVSLLVHAAAVAAILIAPLLAAPPRLPVPDASFVLARPARLPVPEVAPPEASSPEPASPDRAPASTETVAPIAPEPAPIVEPASIAPPPLFAPERQAGSVPGVPRAHDAAGGEPLGPPGPPAGAGPRRVGGDIGPPQKVRDVPPVYPPIARAAGIAGIVIVEAVIDETGAVRDVRVLRSVPLLDEAALTAVRQWRFTPTTLNGAPIPVVMTVSVRFELR
jgi:protein TonB